MKSAPPSRLWSHHFSKQSAVFALRPVGAEFDVALGIKVDPDVGEKTWSWSIWALNSLRTQRNKHEAGYLSSEFDSDVGEKTW